MNVLNEAPTKKESSSSTMGIIGSPVSTSRRIKIVAVDDNPGYLEILEVIMSSAEDIQWLGGYTHPDPFLRDMETLNPDVILMDTRMPRGDGIWLLNELRQRGRKNRVLMLSVVNDNDTIMKALESGAQGYILKSSAGDQLIWAVRDAANGGAPISSSIAKRILERFVAKAAVSKSKKEGEKKPISMTELTKRERELIEHLALGKKYSEIGKAMGITVDTVGTHVRNIYHKLNVRNRTEAAMKYFDSRDI